MEISMWEIEDSLYEKGVDLICGVDEAGRGPLAGPVCAAAVILPRELQIEGLNDSKQLTAKKRDALFDEITEKALAYAIVSVSAAEIDKIDILNARIKAMDTAIGQLSIRPDLALIDGNRDHGKTYAITCPHELLIKGDSRSANIAAASILAKVTRDNLMLELAQQYPEYGFDIHKGYGTKAHYEALRKYGPCPIHRRSFLKKFYGEK